MTANGASRRIAAAAVAAALAAPASGFVSTDDGEEPVTPAEYAAAVQTTVSGCTVSAMLGPSETPLPLDVSNFFLDHPDLSAFIVNRHKIAPYRIETLGPRRSFADDGDGTRGVVNLIEETGRHRLYYGEGIHQSRIFPDIRATAVIAMDLSEAEDSDQRKRTIMKLHVWVRMRSHFVSALMKTLRPLIQGAVVKKFSKAFYVAGMVGRLAARDPSAVDQDVRDFPGVSVEDRAVILKMIAGLRRPRAADR